MLFADPNSFLSLFKYFASLSDLDAIHIFPLLTACDIKSAIEVIEKHNSEPSNHVIQKYLAKYMTNLVHGENLANQAESLSEALFSCDININLSSYNFELLLDSSRFKNISKSSSILPEFTVFEFLKHIFPEHSNNQIRTLIKSGGIRINRKKVTSIEEKLKCDELKDYVLVNNGKTSFFVIKIDY